MSQDGAVTNDDEIARRKQLTFAQAEGASPLPTQLKRTDVSQELRAVLWKCIHDEIKGSAESDGFVWYLRKPWSHILEQVHVYHDHQLVSRGLSTQLKPALQGVEKVFSSGDYLAIYGWLQFVLSIYHPTEASITPPKHLSPHRVRQKNPAALELLPITISDRRQRGPLPHWV